MNPVCMNCLVEMRCTKNGRTVSPNSDILKYQYSGDEFTCKICGSSIVTNFGSSFDSNGSADIVLN